MTQKSPTFWKHNPAKLAGVPYSDSGTTYNSSTTAYSSATSVLAASGKVAEAWNPVAKTPTKFVPNGAAITNLYPFDWASHTYDSAVDTYDGIVVGQDFGDIETPTAWSKL